MLNPTTNTMASFELPSGIQPADILSSLSLDPYTAIVGTSLQTPVSSTTATSDPASNFIPGTTNPGQNPDLTPPSPGDAAAASRKSHISTVLIALVALAGIFIIGVPLLITWRRHHRPASEPPRRRPHYVPGSNRSNPAARNLHNAHHHRHAGGRPDYGSNYYSRGYDDTRRHRRLWAATSAAAAATAADVEAQAGFIRQQQIAARRLLQVEGLDERGEAPPPYKKDDDGWQVVGEGGMPAGEGAMPEVPPPAYPGLAGPVSPPGGETPSSSAGTRGGVVRGRVEGGTVTASVGVADDSTGPSTGTGASSSPSGTAAATTTASAASNSPAPGSSQATTAPSGSTATSSASPTATTAAGRTNTTPPPATTASSAPPNATTAASNNDTATTAARHLSLPAPAPTRSPPPSYTDHINDNNSSRRSCGEGETGGSTGGVSANTGDTSAGAGDGANGDGSLGRSVSGGMTGEEDDDDEVGW